MSLAFLVWAWAALDGRAAFAETETSVASLQSLRDSVSHKGRSIADVRLEGRVCGVNRRLGLIALQDASATEVLELPSLPQDLLPGSWLTVACRHCTITRGSFAIRLGTGPVVEIDGYHPPIERTGAVHLEEGMQPFRLEWFNGSSNAFLALEYAGPGMGRQSIPPQALFRPGRVAGERLAGLNYAAYAGDDWYFLPDFDRLEPVVQATVPDVSLGIRPRPENCGLVFTGFLQVPAAGRYDFFLTADDGARLFVGRPELTCTVQEGDPPTAIAPIPFKAVPAGATHRWVLSEGTVTYAARNRRVIELELTDASGSIPVTIADPSGLDPALLIHRRVQISGVSRASGMVALDSVPLKILDHPSEGADLLTRAVEIRTLKREQAARPLRVALEGTVTMVNPRSLVLQDASGGVFVHYSSPTSADAPEVGELWRIGGITGSGDFSPVVHASQASFVADGVLPTPVRPTWEQLLSGSLDAERVEIKGVIVEAAKFEVRLLTQDGVVRISNHPLYPLPTVAMSPEERSALVGSLVRFRGVYASSWDIAISRVHPAELKLGSATFGVIGPAPQDVFSAPLLRAADLLRFASQSDALRRVRVGGVLLHARPPEYFLSDGGQGFRISCPGAPALQPGDRVETVGFPRPGGPSPVLVEAQVRITGSASLPPAVPVSPDRLPDARLDATRVEMTATLLSDTVRQKERVLEMTAGANHFFAFLPAGEALPARLQRGSVLQLTGTYIGSSAARPLAGPDAFELRLDQAADVEVLRRGPWWTLRHTAVVISILSGGLALAAAWVMVLRRTIARRSQELALEIEERALVERHRLMEQERSRVAQDLHDELGAGLTEAGILSALLKNPAIAPEVKDGYLHQLSGVCFSLVTGLDEIVWAVNPHYDSVAELAAYFSLFAPRFLGLAGIRCRLKIDDPIPVLPLDSSRRHNLFLALKEALNNVVRHSGATEVDLSITVDEGTLRIFLADNGRGFDRLLSSPGCDGVRGMEERIRQLGGVCSIGSIVGVGTKVGFTLFLERTYP